MRTAYLIKVSMPSVGPGSYWLLNDSLVTPYRDNAKVFYELDAAEEAARALKCHLGRRVHPIRTTVKVGGWRP